jgi:pimeloyl-ACP methyl ester carboxylesterase
MPDTVRLTVRSADRRDQLPDPIDPDPEAVDTLSINALTRKRILLLVHGFATPAEKARESYEKFAAKLTAVSESFPGTWGVVCEFHWPGDDSRGRLASVATYSFRIAPAHASAIRLVDFLHEEPYLTPDQDLYIVAHSLGCRVALEALREITKKKNYNGPVVRKVALMAAAVPVKDCLPQDGDFRPTETGEEHVLYSRRDMVLHYAFGIGQGMFGESGRAVGLRGLPDERWRTRTQTGLGHGDYWEKRAVAKRVSAILGTGPVELPENYLPQVEFDIAEPPPLRVLAERLLRRRG